jgi:hypothetical protein
MLLAALTGFGPNLAKLSFRSRIIVEIASAEGFPAFIDQPLLGAHPAKRMRAR